MTIESSESNQSNWPFDEPTNLAAFTTKKVLHESHPILLVTHDEGNGGWQFLCGTTNDLQFARIVSLKRLYEMDPTIGELTDLPLGWRAWRKNPNSSWQREPNPHNNEQDED